MELNLFWSFLAGACVVGLLVFIRGEQQNGFAPGTTIIDISHEKDGKSIARALKQIPKSGDQAIVLRHKDFDEIALPPPIFRETESLPSQMLCNEVTYDHIDDTLFPIHTKINTTLSTGILRKVLNGRIADILPNLTADFVHDLAEIIEEDAESTIAVLSERLAAGLSIRFVYGVSASSVPDLLKQVVQDPDPRAAAAKAGAYPAPIGMLYARFSQHGRRAQAEHRRIWHLTRDLLLPRKHASGQEVASVVSWYRANAAGSHDPMTEQEQCRELYIVLWDAYQSFYSNLAPLFYDLATIPTLDVDALRTEARHVQHAQGTLASKSATAQLPKADSFLKESHRMHPLGYTMLHRRVKAPLTLSNGMRLAPGTLLSSSTYALFRDAHRWPEPETFDAQRYSRMRESGEGRGVSAAASSGMGGASSLVYAMSDASFPMFGTGARICPAMGLAGHVMKIALAEIVLAGDWKLVGEPFTTEEASGLDLGLILERRVRVGPVGQGSG